MSDAETLIKIDVEGYETPVLEGAQKTLEKHELNAVIMELNGSGSRYGYDEARILELMFSYGFKTYSYNPLARKLINLDGKNLNEGNTLFIQQRIPNKKNENENEKRRPFLEYNISDFEFVLLW